MLELLIGPPAVPPRSDSHWLPLVGAAIVRGPLEGTWAPAYYYVLFKDPDGIRLEINHVPGRGVFADGAAFNPNEGYR